MIEISLNIKGAIMTIFNLFSLLGGLALFLFGMDVMGKALEKQAGGKLQTILSKLTDNPIKGFFLGLVVTAIVQSSSATTVMVVGFVNSGIMQLHQAIGVILGSNVGTTVTSWILSLTGIEGDNFLVELANPSAFSPILAFIGIILYVLAKKDKYKGIGTIFLGFATLITGMSTMSAAVKPLQNEAWFTELFVMFTNPILGVIAGAVLTAAIQSSSASVGILQALSSTGAITFGSAIPIIMGQNIGTCITALLSSVGANKNARRAAMVHLYFNVIGVTVFLVGFYSVNAIFKFSFVSGPVDGFGIAIVHTCFNIAATVVLLPFIGLLEKLAYLTIPEDEKKDKIELLDERLLATPAIASERAHSATLKMSEITRTCLFKSMSLVHNWSDAICEEVQHEEEKTDKYEDALGTYLVRLSSFEMTHSDSIRVNTLLHIIHDFERIGDHAINITEAAREIQDKQISFSNAATKELCVLESALQDIFNRTLECLANNDIELATKIEPLEEVIDDLVREIKSNHVARLRKGTCSIEFGFVLDDLLTSYERAADHCSNVAVALIEVSQDSFYTHAYINELHDDNSEASKTFNTLYQKYRARYVLGE